MRSAVIGETFRMAAISSIMIHLLVVSPHTPESWQSKADRYQSAHCFLHDASKLTSNSFQFLAAFIGDRWVLHFEGSERLQDGIRNNKTGVFLVIGRYDVPRSALRAGCAQTGL